ncbi:MAG: mechanosensitive ion channel domain-containing protein [Halopseudomonas sp.]
MDATEQIQNLEKYYDQAIALLMQYGPKLFLALLVLLIGWRVIKVFLNVLDKSMDRHNVEATLQRFLINFTSFMLKTMLLISVASMIGVETTSLIAMLGAAGLAIGLALQGSLSNFAGGALILFFKPFKIGDVIEAQGYLGRVHEIQVFNTIVVTLDNQRVIIPNGKLSNDCIKNVFAEPTRRVDVTFGISYEDDLLKAKEVLRGVIRSDERILSDPESEVYVSAHADSSVNLLVRVWVDSDNYWPVYFNLFEQVKLAFDREQITIPFPQRDVHVRQVSQ